MNDNLVSIGQLLHYLWDAQWGIGWMASYMVIFGTWMTRIARYYGSVVCISDAAGS